MEKATADRPKPTADRPKPTAEGSGRVVTSRSSDAGRKKRRNDTIIPK